MRDHDPHFASREAQQKAHADLVSHIRDHRTSRTYLIHLNVRVPITDEHSPDEIADDVVAALQLQQATHEKPWWQPYHITCILAEEI